MDKITNGNSKHISGVMVSMLALGVVERGFELQLSRTKNLAFAAHMLSDSG